MTGVLHVLVPGGVADPDRPSGGNTYDRRVCASLGAAGWDVRVVEVDGGWPWTPDAGAARLGRVLAGLADGSLVLVDGLLASRLPHLLVPAAARLRVVVLVHLPVGVDDPAARTAEREVLAAVAAVVTTSDWCRRWLAEHYALPADRLRVAPPGVDAAEVARGSSHGRTLLAIGTLGPMKGHDRLLAALACLRGHAWHCRCVGSTSDDAGFVASFRATAAELDVEHRIELPGVLTGDALARVWDGSDLLVLTSRVETYGMVVTEAIARGVPVVATDVGGVAEALGGTGARERPGLLVAADDPHALTDALRRWLTDPDLRARWREAALRHRPRLAGWHTTAARLGAVVREVAA